MKIFVKAKTKAREERVEKVAAASETGRESFVVSVKESPIEDKANRAIIKALAKHFDVAPSNIKIIRGKTSKNKLFEVSK